MAETPRSFRHEDYTVGWIYALPETELVVARAILDEEHPILSAADNKDTNVYMLGRIGSHNVVIACLPDQITGKVSAATVAKDMLRSFKAIRFGLMVGVGGAAPFPEDHDLPGTASEDSEEEDNEAAVERDIRLGDVVVSLQTKTTDAVVQYDFGKSLQGGEFIQNGRLNIPANILLSAVGNLKSKHIQKGTYAISEYLSSMVSANPRLAGKFEYQGVKRDRLFRENVTHQADKKSCKACCGVADVNLVRRRQRADTSPVLHYGTIGSADQVMKDPVLRNKWAQEKNIICFEMEAAGNFIYFTSESRCVWLTI
jgi:nucleoside phosphorylase